MVTLRLMAAFAAVLMLCQVLPAQLDAGQIAKRQGDAKQAATTAQETAKAAIAEIRKQLPETDSKVVRNLDDVELKLVGLEFDAAIGGLQMAQESIDGVKAELRPAITALLLGIGKQLAAGAQANARHDVLKEFEERLPLLEKAIADKDDLTSQLKELDDSTAKANRCQALTREELFALRKHLARHRESAIKHAADEARTRATAELAELERAFAGLRTEFVSTTVATRDSAFAKFGEARASIRDALARIPEADSGARTIREKLAKLEVDWESEFTKTYGSGILERTKHVWESTLGEFEDWEKETGTATLADYVNIDGSYISQLNLPKCAALINRANLWLAFVGTDPEFTQAKTHPELVRLTNTVRAQRDTALARMTAGAQTLVAEAEKTGIADEKARDRLGVLVDWDLRIVLQDTPKQWDLVARLYKLLDAFDRKALGDDKALEQIRSNALKSAEANWLRMSSLVPILGGFEPTQAGKFKGPWVRLEKLRERTADFRPGDHDLVFTTEGCTFAGKYEPALAKALEVAFARSGARLTPELEIELIFTVGEEGKLALVGPSSGGKSDDIEIPCRRLRVFGLRAGALAFIAK